MTPQYWKQKWKVKDIAFHQRSINRHLRKYFQIKKTTVFVPLCGKSKDMLWLAEQGHKVVGVEASEIACEEFFIESHLKFKISKRDSFAVYESKSITIWCGDFFKLPSTALRRVSAIYDRAAMIALPKPIRKKYVVQLLKLLKVQKVKLPIHLLLLTIEYPQPQMKGPPFSVPLPEIKKLYGKSLVIRQQKLIAVPMNKRTPKLKTVAPLTEGVYVASVGS